MYNQEWSEFMPRRERPTPLPALVFTLKVVVPAPGHGTRNFRSYYVPRPSTTQLASLAARAETRSNRVVILLGAWVLAGSTIIRNSVVRRNYHNYLVYHAPGPSCTST